MSYSAFIVGGTFDREQGKPSKLIQAIATQTGWPCLNGGNLTALREIDFKKYDVMVWMPNIDNVEEKLLPEIKKINPHLTLIQSKRVVEKSYTEFDVITRLMKSRSNLGIMITQENRRFRFRLLDPLGNQFCDTQDVAELSKALKDRVDTVRSLTRIPSVSMGHLPDDFVGPSQEFVDLIRAFGDEFSKHVNAANPERFLGNASARPTDRITRCCHGFPAFREAGYYLVSRRNVDKTSLTARDFVPILQQESQVQYAGDVKPSVDAPVQIRLFNYYANVNFIVHGHVYLDQAPMTQSKIPCGSIEEFGEITALFPSQQACDFSVNLKGHGCLILANSLDYLRAQKNHLKSRQFPEP